MQRCGGLIAGGTRVRTGRVASLSLALFALAASGCSALKSYWQRNLRPSYTITPDFYAAAPRRIAVLPFTPRWKDRERAAAAQAGAEALRLAFYSHISVKSYEDVELSVIDGLLKRHGLLEDTLRPAEERLAEKLAGALKAADLTGITGFLNLAQYADQLGLMSRPEFGQKRFEQESFQALKKVVPADAFVTGTSREYGWLYAVLLSYVRVGCTVEMHSADTGALLWKGKGKGTSFSWIGGSLFDIPVQFVTIWLNTRQKTLDRLTDEIFTRLLRTMADLDHPVKVEVRATSRAPVFKRPGYSYFPWARYGTVARGTRMKYLLEQDGWYQVETTVGSKLVTGWVFGGHAEVIDTSNPDVVLRPKLTSSEVFLR